MKRNKIDIITAIDEPGLFRPLFPDIKSWFGWRVFLKSVFALPMKDAEFDMYKTHTGRTEPPMKRAEEVFAIIGRRGGKSFIVSLIACYMVLFENFWLDGLAIGERAVFPIIATDRVQAKIIFNYIQGILNSNPLFKQKIIKESTFEIELKNYVSIEIKTASFRGIRGAKYIGGALDELAFWRDVKTYANPASEIIKGIRPAIVEGGILFGISSAFNRIGVLYDEFSEHYGKDKNDTLIWKADTLSMNPTYSKKRIDKALRKDVSHARAEYFSIWREDLSSLLSAHAIDNAIILGRQELPPTDRIRCYAFIDPSGGRHDSFTLAIGHYSQNGKIVIDLLRERKPPFKPSEVVSEFKTLTEYYGSHEVVSDKYGAEWVKEVFSKEGISLVYSDLTASELYINMLPEFSDNRIELPENNNLRAQLMGLMRKTVPGGKDKVIADPALSGHSDLANAVAGVINIIKKDSVQPGSEEVRIVSRKKYINQLFKGI
jgi:hypothetical protein